MRIASQAQTHSCFDLRLRSTTRMNELAPAEGGDARQIVGVLIDGPPELESHILEESYG